MLSIILASKSKVREEILKKNGINCTVVPSNIDEDPIKKNLLKNGASPEIISKNLAEEKACIVSKNTNGKIVLGADSVIDLDGKIVSKPKNREKAFEILKNLNGKSHYLISSVCICKNGSKIWNYTDKAKLTMKKMSDVELKEYLRKISDEKYYWFVFYYYILIICMSIWN